MKTKFHNENILVKNKLKFVAYIIFLVAVPFQLHAILLHEILSIFKMSLVSIQFLKMGSDKFLNKQIVVWFLLISSLLFDVPNRAAIMSIINND